MDYLPNPTLHLRDCQVRMMSRDEPNNRAHSGPLYVCAFCKSPFQLPAGSSLSIRFSGRIPEVECPECADRRDTDESTRS